MTEALADRRVLIAADDDANRFLVSRFLREMTPRQPLLASDGRAALDLLAANPVDCIVSELNLRPIGGLQLLKTVRTGGSAARRDLPVVLCIGPADIDRIGVALALEVDAFVAKPIAKTVLLARIRRSLEQPAPDLPVEAYRAIEIPPPADGRAAGAAPGPTHRDGPEVLVALAEVGEGRRLSRLLTTRDGTALIAAGTPLSRRSIDRLHDLVMLDPSLEHLWVHV